MAAVVGGGGKSKKSSSQRTASVPLPAPPVGGRAARAPARPVKAFVPDASLDPSQIQDRRGQPRPLVYHGKVKPGSWMTLPPPYPDMGGLNALKPKKPTPGPKPTVSTRATRQRVGGY